MINRKTKYALSALVYLARQDRSDPILISKLASDERIPRKFLESILLELKNYGILKSRKGKGGGYSLARPPELIRLGHVIRFLEGPLAPVPCVSETAYQPCEDCVDEAACGIRLVMKQVRDSTARILDSTTLADIVPTSTPSKGKRKKQPSSLLDR